MKNVVNFDDADEWYEYLTSKNMRINKLGEGSEGECFGPTISRECYKIIDEESSSFGLYDTDDIVTEKELSLDSFAFPRKLYLLQGNLIAYKSKYINDDYFKRLDDYNTNEIKKIDFNKLKIAYYEMKKDVIKLSKNNIEIFDLSNNLLFDGEKLYGIDTCGYFKSNKKDLLQRNLKTYDDAIKDVFSICTMNDIRYNELLEKNYDQPVEIYLTIVEHLYKKKNNKSKTYVYRR